MKYRQLGKAGVKVSEIALGAWLTFGSSVEQETAFKCLNAAIDQGINFIDIADVYAHGKAEEVVGAWLKEETVRRKDLVISSKVFWPMSENVNDRGLSRKHILESIDGTLTRLGIEYLDIYYAHRFDKYTPLEETIATMGDLIADREIFYWGTSVWTAAKLERAVAVAKELGVPAPAVEQPPYNMLERYIEMDVMETTAFHGIGLTVWSPLAGGILTGKYNEGIPPGSRAAEKEWMKSRLTEETLSKVKQLTELAKELEITPSQLALAWILRRSEITSAITGATKAEHVKMNAQASGIQLDNDVLNRIEEILHNKVSLPSTYLPPW